MSAPTYQTLQFGGVDSRSNPVNMPQERCLRCRNWIVTEAGYLRLRDGYTRIANSRFSATIGESTSYPAVHSITHYHRMGGHHYALVGYGQYLGSFDINSGSLIPQIANPNDGTATGNFGTGDWQWAISQGKFYGVNGNGCWWYDGANAGTVVETGLRPLTDTDVASVVVTGGVRELTSAERAACVVGHGASGTFTGDTYGRLVYCVLFDPANDERGPATQYIGSGRVSVALNEKINLSSLPNVAASLPGYVKLFAITGDGTVPAYFCTNTSTAITNIQTIAPTHSGCTVYAVGHGLSNGDVVVVSGNDKAEFNDIFSVTVLDADHFSIARHSGLTTVLLGTGGTVKRIVKVSDAATSATISAPTVDTSIVANEDRGVPASSVSAGPLTDPGYQFYASLYRQNNGGHVGNRIKIGARFVPTVRQNVRISGLPTLSGSGANANAYMIGRTGDGGVVPYAVMDSGGNRIYALNGVGLITITQSSTDGTAELPTRNGMPVAMDKIVRVGDFLYGNEANSATIRRSGSEQTANQGYFLGVPAESWAANDIDTFPTGEPVTCLAEEDYELVAWTLNDMAVLSDVSGIMGWRGPWNIGNAGKRATTKTPYGRYWVTGDKQLGSVKNGIPVTVSGEYEAALLSRIGDAYLGETEVEYEKNIEKKLDRLVIRCIDSTGQNFIVYHDFKLRDGRSEDGQAYETIYAGELVNPFTISQVRDANGTMKLYAGGNDGYLYELETSTNDNGAEFTTDYIALVNLGIGRQAVTKISWQGDQRLGLSIGERLNKTLDPPNAFTILCGEGEAVSVQDNFGADNFKWEHKDRVPSPELLHAYLRLQLTSSAAGSMALNEPPHLPVEDYGKIYAMQFNLGQERGTR